MTFLNVFNPNYFTFFFMTRRLGDRIFFQYYFRFFLCQSLCVGKAVCHMYKFVSNSGKIHSDYMVEL